MPESGLPSAGLPEMTARFPLPEERPEIALAEKKPLMTWAEAKTEAERCLYCADAPCTEACPAKIDVPTFIKKIATENLRGSARTILEKNMLGWSCGRVCPVEELCEGACVHEKWQHKPVQIGRLQRYATEHGALRGGDLLRAKPATGKKVACVGAGPASLACAAVLALEGHEVVLYERRARPGGLNATAIAPYKLHADDALREASWLLSLGRIRVEAGTAVGEGVRADELLAKYDAVFLGVGLGDDAKLGVPGEDGPDALGAVAWVEAQKTRAGPRPKLGRVVVVGGGNTAIDVAHEAALFGAAEVTMVYRRAASDMSGYAHELDAARKDGVRLATGETPVAVLREGGAVRGVRLARTNAGKPVAGAERDLPCDLVLVAIGQAKLRDVATAFRGVELDEKGCVRAEAGTGKTGHPKVWAGGDCVNGGTEVVNAAAEGRDAARSIMKSWEKK